MTTTSMEERIEVRPEVLVGKPIIRGTRISVEFILDLLSAGWSEADILESYPHLTVEDIRACLRYAGDIVKQERVFPLTAA